MSLSEQVAALRGGVVFGAREMALLRLRGEHAFDLLDAVCPRPLFLRDGQAMHSLLLTDEGRIWADLYVICDDLDYVLMAEGPTSAELQAWLLDHAGCGLDVELQDQSQSHVVIGLDGPYAWELLGKKVGPDVVGVPYMNLFFIPEWRGFGLRAGKTGEYGYDLVVPRELELQARQELEQIGTPFEARSVSLDTLDLCALENGFFCIRAPGMRDLTPVEMQLQWRLDLRRNFPGAEAVRRRQKESPPRVTWVRGEQIPRSRHVELEIATGELLYSRTSPLLGVVGQVLLPRPYAHPGLPLQVGGCPFQTVSAPLLHNRSLFLDPQRHAWSSRHLDSFPPLVP